MVLMTRRSFIVVGLVVAGACSNPAATPPEPPPPALCTFSNPIGSGQDPWVVKDGSSYYLTESIDNAIYVYKSDQLTSLKKNPVKVWAAPDTGWNRTNI